LARKILLADDSVTAQNMGRKILADAGYEVITVNNGSAALKKIAEVKPDLIVLDVYMPGYSGLEVCQRLKEVHESARIPVLLTVGKLEPFKPEEAKRVRAEGFIVKPFEASELLTALSKLEDKIVPRAEPSKPGRFARAIAAVEETGRFGGDEPPADENSGWKNRIAFPRKKKEQTEKEHGDEAATYNAVNRDMRTVVESTPASPPETAVEPENRVDLGALGAPGIPRDVSPDEIAAITAAAVQMQATGAAQESEPRTPDRSKDRSQPEGQATPGLEDGAGTQLDAGEAKLQESPAPSAEVTSAPAHSSTEVSAAATFAETSLENFETRPDAGPADRRESRNDKGSEIAGLIPANVNVDNRSSSSLASSLFASASSTEDPVTMAVAPSSRDALEKRWTAVPVAVSPDEAAVSLEHEMQKAYAAFAAAEANLPGFVSSMPAPDVTLPPEAVAPAPTAESEPAPQASDSEPGRPHWINALATASSASASTDALGAVSEFSTVAASHAGLPGTGDDQQSSSGPPAIANSETIVGAEAMPRTDDLAAPVRSEGPVSAGHDTPPVEAKAAADEPPADTTSEAPAAPQAATEPIMAETTAARGESAVGGMRDMADQRESEAAASTAAAWASWRQIRETGQPEPAVDERTPSRREIAADEPSSSAAMAAAAGAEKAPEPFSDSSDPTAIASIVDSVLADLRPKIVEEISRKLGKRK
jgi:two-component system, chemotaxis family, chemotaxis protein CheY